jgi:hypothetical protein
MADGLMYSCNRHEIYDGEMAGGMTVETIEKQLVDHARELGKEPTAQPRTIPGATAGRLVSYRQNGRYSFDLVATEPLDGNVRAIVCHMPWFEDADKMSAFEDTCARTMTTLLERAPAGRKLSPECRRATQELEKLPGRSEPADGSPELRAEVSAFANRCTDGIAACALAAKTYAEATLCR